MTVRRIASALSILVVGLARPAIAQIDYRNLDDGRPVATEDAYPIERHAFELLVPYRVEQPHGGRIEHAIPLELAYGIADNTQLGVSAPLGGVPRNSDDGIDWGLGGIDLSGLYNFNTESAALPAVSFRAAVRLPAGSLAGSAARVTLKAIATRSWGRSRVHVNALRSFGTERDLGRAETAPRWQYGLALDRTLFRQSLLVVGDVVAARTVAGAPIEVNAGAGIRWQWTPTVVLDLGVARRLRSEVGPDYALSIGASHTFALAWLMPARGR